jgi:hypothetical protein
MEGGYDYNKRGSTSTPYDRPIPPTGIPPAPEKRDPNPPAPEKGDPNLGKTPPKEPIHRSSPDDLQKFNKELKDYNSSKSDKKK